MTRQAPDTSRGQKRTAAHVKNGILKKTLGIHETSGGPKFRMQTAVNPKSSAVASTISDQLKALCRCPSRSIKNGARMIAASRSPTHQMVQEFQKLAHCTSPCRHMRLTPQVAPNAVGMIPANTTYLSTSRGVKNALIPFASRITKATAMIASSVHPKAVPSAYGAMLRLKRSMKNAPAKIAGSALRPFKKRAAYAIPVGGQNAVGAGLGGENRCPNFPLM